MRTLPHELYRAEQVRELDRLAIERLGIEGYALMERAGEAAYARLRERWPDAHRVAILCGTGNNGGDGFVVARLAKRDGLDVRVLQLGESDRIGGAAALACAAAREAGVAWEDYDGRGLQRYDLLVDALLGTGLTGEVAEPWSGAIAAMNGSAAPTLAIDIPSGLSADTGAVLGSAAQAAATVTFIGLKQGLFTGEGPACCGEVRFEGLDVPADVYGAAAPSAHLMGEDDFAPFLAPRPRTAHKGHYGHVLVVGGEEGFAGAARMAAEASARVGAGLTSVATRAAHAAQLGAGRPELMCRAVEEPGQLEPLLRRATVVAIGPGLSRGPWGRAMLARILESHLPLVVDADALNALADEPARRDDWILTPHPGEAGRLLGCSPREVQGDRFAAAAGIQASFGGVCVLKGAGTLVDDGGGPPALCRAGNPGMASGGMGDVLTGVIAGLLAQGMGLETAARLGVWLHASAADAAAAAGERGMLATDLYPHLRCLANPSP